jgi:hypothetical protein
MTRHVFNGNTAETLANLDANFVDLYNLREAISTASYTGATPSNIGIGTASGNPRVSVAQDNPTSGNVVQVSNTHNVSGRTGTYMLFDASGLADWQAGIKPDANIYAIRDSLANQDRLLLDSSSATPGTDNNRTLGSASSRWSVVYAGTGTINTSDAREKTTVTALTSNEVAAATALAREIGSYKWLTALQDKGADARTHIGMTVQRAMDVMTAHSLDPLAYGFICYDSWDEVRDGADTVTQPAGDRYAFRTDELLLFLARGFDARLAALEAA